MEGFILSYVYIELLSKIYNGYDINQIKKVITMSKMTMKFTHSIEGLTLIDSKGNEVEDLSSAIFAFNDHVFGEVTKSGHYGTEPVSVGSRKKFTFKVIDENTIASNLPEINFKGEDEISTVAIKALPCFNAKEGLLDMTKRKFDDVEGFMIGKVFYAFNGHARDLKNMQRFEGICFNAKMSSSSTVALQVPATLPSDIYEKAREIEIKRNVLWVNRDIESAQSLYKCTTISTSEYSLKLWLSEIDLPVAVTTEKMSFPNGLKDCVQEVIESELRYSSVLNSHYYLNFLGIENLKYDRSVMFSNIKKIMKEIQSRTTEGTVDHEIAHLFSSGITNTKLDGEYIQMDHLPLVKLYASGKLSLLIMDRNSIHAIQYNRVDNFISEIFNNKIIGFKYDGDNYITDIEAYKLCYNYMALNLPDSKSYTTEFVASYVAGEPNYLMSLVVSSTETDKFSCLNTREFKRSLRALDDYDSGQVYVGKDDECYFSNNFRMAALKFLLEARDALVRENQVNVETVEVEEPKSFLNEDQKERLSDQFNKLLESNPEYFNLECDIFNSILNTFKK